MQEIWKDVPEFEDSYQVSSFGNLRSKDRYRKVCGGGSRLVKGKPIKPVVLRNGYLEASFARNRERKVILLHRLVAKVFIKNPSSLPEVNHKDENPKNCRADNLEWCTSKYNANYGSRNDKCWANNHQKIKVKQYTIGGELIGEYPSIGRAAKAVNGHDSSIIKVCKGKQKTACGYVWRYAEVTN